ncbi:MAG: Fic family protein [Colwellia sp.]|nr:Fic family protein [Colwellia sp.]
MYHWEGKYWPLFKYDVSRVTATLNEYSKKAYSVEGSMSQLSSTDHDDAYVYLLVEEALSTSAIEGEKLNREEVRSSVARFLGLKEPERGGYFPKEKGIAAMLIDVRKSVSIPMSKSLLCHWHGLLLHGSEDYYVHSIIKGDYRYSSIGVVREDLYGETETIYKAPGESRDKVELEMNAFFQWYNDDTITCEGSLLSGPVKAAIAHLWFVAIHPFQDGNGRVGRAIAEHALFQDFARPPLFSISTVINTNRMEYYQQLRKTNSTLVVDDWVVWFVELVKKSQTKSLESIEFVLKKSKFWAAYGEIKLNIRQEKVMNKIFSVGADGFVRDGLTNEKYRAITGAPPATATRDLKSLVSSGLLIPSGAGKRGLRYFVNFPQKRELFEPKKASPLFDEIALAKLIKKIERNVDYFRGEKNPGLSKLIDEYKALTQGSDDAEAKLKSILI